MRKKKLKLGDVYEIEGEIRIIGDTHYEAVYAIKTEAYVIGKETQIAFRSGVFGEVIFNVMDINPEMRKR